MHVSGLAHLYELSNKITLAREEYLIVQSIYRGWDRFGLAILAALLSTLILAVREWGHGLRFYLVVTGFACLALTMVVFFSFTYPANQQTANWTTLPENWQQLRRQWEYSHATSAVLYFVAFASLTLSLLVGRK